MKKLVFFFLCLLFVSCSQKQAVNVAYEQFKSPEDPQENLRWLKELINKAENDNTGNYLGCIWLVSYKGKDFFVTNMMLGSGGVLYLMFDCFGNHLAFNSVERCAACSFVGNNHFYIEEADDFPQLNELEYNIVVYSSQGCPCDEYFLKP